MSGDAGLPFLPPDPPTMARIVQDRAIRVRYTRALHLLNDALCAFSDDHGHPEFRDLGELNRQIKESIGIDPPIDPDPLDREVYRNLRINRRRALALRKRAKATTRTADRDAVRAEVAAFLDAMIGLYGDVLRESAGGSGLSRAKGA